MFLIEILNEILLTSLMPESGALLLCSISLVGSAIAARRFLKHKGSAKNERQSEDELKAEK